MEIRRFASVNRPGGGLQLQRGKRCHQFVGGSFLIQRIPWKQACVKAFGFLPLDNLSVWK